MCERLKVHSETWPRFERDREIERYMKVVQDLRILGEREKTRDRQ